MHHAHVLEEKVEGCWLLVSVRRSFAVLYLSPFSKKKKPSKNSEFFGVLVDDDFLF